VSVCVPAYRAARFIGRTIESVLAQTLDDFELVVVDDASPDGTAEIASGFSDARLRLERNPANLGVAGNWNRAVEMAEGRYVKVLCDDDVLYPECLASQVAIMEAHPDVALVAGSRDVIDESGRVLLSNRGLAGLVGRVDGGEAVRAAVKSGTNIFGEPVCVLLRRELIPVCGPFCGLRPYMIDLDYWCRMLRLGALYAQRRPVGAFRVVGTSLSVHLAGRQRREAVELFRQLQADNPSVVRPVDVAVGAARATSLALGRAASYRFLRPNRRRGQDGR
jgi:glycosyltransferase involved in cell wall biosynthesis